MIWRILFIFEFWALPHLFLVVSLFGHCYFSAFSCFSAFFSHFCSILISERVDSLSSCAHIFDWRFKISNIPPTKSTNIECYWCNQIVDYRMSFQLLVLFKLFQHNGVLVCATIWQMADESRRSSRIFDCHRIDSSHHQRIEKLDPFRKITEPAKCS